MFAPALHDWWAQKKFTREAAATAHTAER